MRTVVEVVGATNHRLDESQVMVARYAFELDDGVVVVPGRVTVFMRMRMRVLVRMLVLVRVLASRRRPVMVLPDRLVQGDV